LTGKAIASAKGSKVVAKTNGYKGVAIVKVTTDKGANVQKVLLNSEYQLSSSVGCKVDARR